MIAAELGLVVSVVGAVLVVLTLLTRDIAIRYFADRAHARTLRASEAEAAAALVTTRQADIEKRFRELEQRVGAFTTVRKRN
jgi:hypothetical protein